MQTPRHALSLEEQIDQWRSYFRRRQAIHSVDIAELEDHLREQVAGLVDAGLATDEAFLVAVKRMGKRERYASGFLLKDQRIARPAVPVITAQWNYQAT